ncbi:SPOR domain-containing protein [Xanthomonadaceae bacterium XH05]|nr:SPOR domain-containing protein [Xanthomonadaceae bacterium XH05]
MARRKSQARRGNQRRIPVWIWLLGGVLLGLGLSAVVLIADRDGRLPVPRPNPSATAPRESEPAIAPAPTPEPEKAKPRYDFYTLLRERETHVTDKELAEKVKAESAQPSTVTTPPQQARERYLLQAGAFRDMRDADAVKARIALAGMQARVEAADVNGSAVYRVRLGPYATARDLEDAKRQLAENGVPDTVAVRESLN